MLLTFSFSVKKGFNISIAFYTSSIMHFKASYGIFPSNAVRSIEIIKILPTL